MENKEKMEDIRAKIDDYLDVIDSFSDTLKVENQALKDYNVDALTALYNKKVKGVLAYRGLVAFFMKNRDFMNGLSEDEREDLKAASFELNELLKENDMLLKSRMKTSQTIMDSIVNIAKVTTKSNSTAYGAQGGYAKLDNSRSALAINKTL